jgi:hypothetical protein
VFPLVRQARTADDAVWPKGLPHLNRSRHLANIVGDAALYQHLQGDDRATVELVRDMLHLSKSLRAKPQPNDLVPLLVSVGIDALNMDRLMTIASSIRLTNDPADTKALQTRDAAELIEQLLDVPTAEETMKRIFEDHAALSKEPELQRASEAYHRAASERAMAAMSLAAHLFRHEKGQWPASLDELATKLPRVPVDPWGDGKETLGYALIKGGLPDGSDRPLVYSRCKSENGLFYRVDSPQYSFYTEDGSNRPRELQTRGGQFRDVSRWTPRPLPEGAPTVLPLKAL